MRSIKSIAAQTLGQFFRQLPAENLPRNPAHPIQFVYLFVLQRLLGLPQIVPPELVQSWLRQIRENQQADGYFLQNATVADFSQLSFSALSVAALQIADQETRFPLYFTRVFADHPFTESWFQQSQNILITPECPIKQALETGKTFLYTSSLLGKGFSDGILTDTVLAYFFNCSDARANPETGFWVQNESQLSVQGLVDGWSRVQAYFFFKRSLPYPQKMLHSLLRLQRQSGHFHSSEEYFLLTDLAALTILAELSRQAGGFQFRIQRTIRRVIKAVNQLAPVETDFLPPFPKEWFAESSEFSSEVENNLQQIVLFYYRMVFQQLSEFVHEKKRNVNFEVRMTSPCFTFQPATSVENND
jgi:hypothetical protein